MVYLTENEGYYNKIVEAHARTGHERPDRMVLYIQSWWRITDNACQLFLSMCHSCIRKRVILHKSIMVKLILSEGWIAQGQVDSSHVPMKIPNFLWIIRTTQQNLYTCDR